MTTPTHTAVWIGHDRNGKEDRKTFTYQHRPTLYLGVHIFKLHDREYHAVEDGIIIGMYAGPRGVRRFINQHVGVISDVLQNSL